MAVAAGVSGQATGVVERLELRSFDLRFAAFGGPTVDTAGIVIVSFDEESQAALRERYGSSGRRLIDARLIDRLRRARPEVIAYDFQFTEPSERGSDDNALLRAVSRTPGIVLATAEVFRGNHEVLGGPEAVATVPAFVGDSVFPLDADGAARRMVYRPRGLRTFAVAAAEAARGRPLDSAQLAGGAWIAFQGAAGAVRSYSVTRILDGRVPASALRHKVVVVGPGDPALGDVHRTPLDAALPGVELQANAIATALGGFPLSRGPAGLDYALIVLLGLVAPLASLRWSVVRTLTLAAVALVAFVVLAQLAFTAGTVVAVASPVVALLVGTAGAFVVTYILEIRERRRLRGIFARFVPEDVAARAVASTAVDLRSGGERLEATVMFADLRGFTRFAEGLRPAVVSEALNRYLTGMSEAIQDEGGTVVSYMGDGIMAVFGAPTERPDHAARAVAAARAMTGPRLDRFNEWLDQQGLGAPFRMGVGLSTGEVLSGNVGSAERVEYTALGDTTNVAARLEAMTKTTEHSILMTEATVDQLPAAQGLELLQVGKLELPGRTGLCTVWTLDGRAAETPTESASPSASPIVRGDAHGHTARTPGGDARPRLAADPRPARARARADRARRRGALCQACNPVGAGGRRRPRRALAGQGGLQEERPALARGGIRAGIRRCDHERGQPGGADVDPGPDGLLHRRRPRVRRGPPHAPGGAAGAVGGLRDSRGRARVAGWHGADDGRDADRVQARRP